MSGERAEVAIVRAGAERLDDLQPLWEALHRHHLKVAPELAALAPARTPQESWQVRRAHYVELFEDRSTFTLIAELDSAAIGYALAHLRYREESWQTGEVAELETLAVRPDHRGRGVGTRLMRALFEELDGMNVSEWSVGVIAANQEALRFYGRFEVLRFMTSFIGRVPSSNAS